MPVEPAVERAEIHRGGRDHRDGPRRTGRTADLLRIEVADTGPGIAAADRDALFQPFAAGRTRSARVRAAGLGLSISRTLARQMGGDLVLIDAPGARFALTLALAAALPASAAHPHRAAGRPPLAGLRVLVVDDIATNRLVAEAHLRALGIATAAGRLRPGGAGAGWPTSMPIWCCWT